MPIIKTEFCPHCGALAVDKDEEQEVNSKWDIILKCTCCEFEGKVLKTICLTREIRDDKSLNLQYLQFPADYKYPKQGE